MKDTLGKVVEPTADGVGHTNGSGDGTVDLSTEEYVSGTQSSMAITRKRRPWRIILPLAIVVLLALAAAWWLLTPPKALPTATVTRGTIASTVETTGKLEAETSAQLSFKTSGQVEKVLVKQGDEVEAGQVLAELDTA